MSEIKQMMKEKMEEMEALLRRQPITMGDAHKLLANYNNIYRRMEQLEESRDGWKKQAEENLTALKNQRIEVERLQKLVRTGKVEQNE